VAVVFRKFWDVAQPKPARSNAAQRSRRVFFGSRKLPIEFEKTGWSSRMPRARRRSRSATAQEGRFKVRAPARDFIPLTHQTVTRPPDDDRGHLYLASVHVNLHPEDRQTLADPLPGSQHERGQIREIGCDGVRVLREGIQQPVPFFQGQRSGIPLGLLFQTADVANRIVNNRAIVPRDPRTR
jgi:hypothetical protein